MGVKYFCDNCGDDISEENERHARVYVQTGMDENNTPETHDVGHLCPRDMEIFKRDIRAALPAVYEAREHE